MGHGHHPPRVVVEPVSDSPRRLAVALARARVGAGAALLLAGGPLGRLSVGADGSGSSAAWRVAGGRDLALGVGTLTSVHERTQDAEWVGMSALVDGIDAAVLLLTPRLPVRARLLGLVAAGGAVAGLIAARALADERDQAIPDGA
jgi:hypothetical protein